MKRLAVISFVLMLTAAGSIQAAAGTSFGCLTTANSLGQGKGNLGGGIGIADNTTFFGTFAFGLSEYTDGRLKLGLIDVDGLDTKLVFGADFKWQFWSVTPPSAQQGAQSSNPFDFAVGGFFEFTDLEHFSILQVGAQLIGSYPFVLKKGGTLSPYGRINARLESFSWDNDFPGNPDSESNLEGGFNAGVEWKMSSDVMLYGEFQFDGNDGVFFGIDFNVM